MYALDQIGILIPRDGDSGLGLAKQRDNGLAGVASDDGDSQALGIALANDLSDKGLGTHDVEGGDAEEALRVENALGLKYLSGDGDGRVDGVRDNKDICLRGDLGDSLNQALDDAGVDVEQVVASHAGFACGC